jgi:NADPH-dependent 2,4-dienoyl-CoA reductase/sulfur reductase-like enzyme
MERRQFLQYLSAGLLTSSTSLAWARRGEEEEEAVAMKSPTLPADRGIKGNIVVVGGGMAGTTVAKYLRLWGGTGVNVTLVEPNAQYYSNIFSNMILEGTKTLDDLTFNYKQLVDHYGVKVLQQTVTAIDPTTANVTLADGTKLPYDRVVLATGIDFDDLPLAGSDTNKAKIVHAWQAGQQTVSLQQQIAAMTAKDTFILTIPPKPFRCPPGPYERACVVADYLQREKEGGTVVILDANPEIQAGAKIFNAAYSDTFKDIITYVPNATLESIDADKGTVKTSAGSFNGTVINAIPAQKAGKLITTSDLKLASQGGRWAGVDVLTYESTVIPKVHIIGDSSATTQPKAGHIANAEAKVCADAILNLLQGKAVNQNPITNSACYSPITQDTAAWMSVVFRYDPESKTMKPSKAGIAESNKASERNHKEMMKWFNNLMSDTFA